MKREKTNELLIHLGNVENTSLDLFQHYLQTQYGDYLYLSTDINNNNNNNMNFNHNPKYVQDIVQNEKITLSSGLDQQFYIVYVNPLFILIQIPLILILILIVTLFLILIQILIATLPFLLLFIL